MSRSSLHFLLLFLALQASAAAAVRCEIDHAVIDGVSIRYDAPIRIVGICMERDWHDLSPTQADLQAVRINGRGNQDQIVVHLKVVGLPMPEPGKWYEVHGRLADGNADAPVPCFSMTVDQIEPVQAAPLTPADFVDREADFEGIAASGGGLKLESETIHVTDWPAGAVGKHVGVRGVVKKDDAEYRIDQPEWRLLDLADLAGKAASLEGQFCSLNGEWWFAYRDQRLIVTDAQDHPARLDGQRHGGRRRVTGLLVNQLRPSLDQISLKIDRDLVPTFVLRRAKIEFVEPPIDPDRRFREIFPTACKMVDGVPELLAEDIVRRNIMGNETRAGGYTERNRQVIEAVLRTATPATLDVLAKRMSDPSVNSSLRLVYATMLAAANDGRGRAFLTDAAGRTDDDFHSTLFCLGAFAWLMPDDARTKTELAWAEPLLVKLMTDRDAAGRYITAPDAVTYSDIPSVLARLDTPAARKVLIDYAAADVDPPNSFFRANALRILAQFDVHVDHQQILRLEQAIRNPADRRSVLHIALRENDAVAASRFFNELGDDNWFEQDFHDYLTPQMVAALRDRLGGLRPKAQPAARMLIILGQKDPVPSLIALLTDPTWHDKNSAVWELAERKDPRAAAPVMKILKEGPANFFQGDEFNPRFLPDDEAGQGVRGGIDAIASAGTREAVTDLIDLLDDDLTRFSKSYDRQSYRRIIAAHLIDITGESFGTDAAAWRKWEASR